MMHSQTVSARDAKVPLQVIDRVRIAPHSNRVVLIGTAGGTILVAMKNQWGSITSLLNHDRVALNLDVREHEIEHVQAMGPIIVISKKLPFNECIFLMRGGCRKQLADMQPPLQPHFLVQYNRVFTTMWLQLNHDLEK